MVRSWAPHVPRGTRFLTPGNSAHSLALVSLSSHRFDRREPRIRRLSDADGFPPDPLHEAIACAQVSCLFVHEVSEHHGPAGCEVVSAIRFGREGHVPFRARSASALVAPSLESLADGAGGTP